MYYKFFLLLMSSFFLAIGSHAQLCQGSLGDPIINITFGSGSNPGAALSAAATNYQYSASDCPADGLYTVRNSTGGCFGATWHSLSVDHTGNPAGYFMLVNASYQPGAFYVDTVKGLCGNTNYEFAAWVMNVLVPSACNNAGIQPNLTFTIERTDGTVLQTYNSGDISSTSSPQWKQYGFYFTTPPAGSDIVVRIVNNAPGGCGNDLALDDITFRPCGPQIINTINGVQAAPVSFCEGTAHTYQLNCTASGGFINPVFQWQAIDPATAVWSDIPGATTNNYTISFPANTPPNTYQLRIAAAESGNMSSLQCRIYSKPFVFTVNSNPVTTASNNSPICAGNTAILSATGGVQYSWVGPNGVSGNGTPFQLPNAQPIQSGRYFVTVTNAATCTKTDFTDIIVNPAPTAATAFSQAVICAGDTIQLSATGGPSYLWYPVTGLSTNTIAAPKAAPRTNTTYYVVVTNADGCKDTASSIIIVNPGPVANAGPDKVLIKGRSVQLDGVANLQGNSITWSPPLYINDITALQPVVTPPFDQEYILKVTSDNGCGVSRDTVNIKVYNALYIPNTFTPNNDRINDTWIIDALAAYSSFDLRVFDRWGKMVFHATNAFKAWDGKYKGEPCPDGSYTYFITTSEGLQKGFVLILR